MATIITPAGFNVTPVVDIASALAAISAGNNFPATPTLPFGELIAEARHDDISVQFQYPFYNTEFDMKPAVGTGSVLVADGFLNVIAGVGETEHVETKNTVRYRPGHSGYDQFTAGFVGDGVGYGGVLAVDEDGFYIKLDNGVPHLGILKGGVETNIAPSGSRFAGGNIDLSQIDFSNVNIYRILFGYLGVANPIYEIKLGGAWHTLGEIQTEGLGRATHINNPVLPLGFKAVNNMTVLTASMNAGKMGNSDFVGGRPFCADLSKEIVGTTKTTLGTFRNKDTFFGVTNRVKSWLVRYEFSVDAPAAGSGTVQFRVEKNPTLSGTPVWVDQDTENSVIELDTIATYASGGRTMLVEHVDYAAGTGNAPKSGGGTSELAIQFGLYLLPGETATITGQNVGLGDVNIIGRAVFNWVDLF